MTPELTYLTYSVALLFVHIVIQASWSDLTIGLGWALGPQDERPKPSVTAGRIERALANFLQTYPAFIALVVASQFVTDIDKSWIGLGAAVWFWARVVYVPAFASGIPLARTVVWLVSVAGLLMMLFPLLAA